MSEPKNIDSVLVKEMSEQATGVREVPVPAQQNVPEIQHEAAPEPVQEQQSEPEHAESEPENVPHRTSEEKPEPAKAEGDSPIDEYGNPVAPPRMYSEEEVNRMMRERLSRGRHAEMQPPPNSQPQHQEQSTDQGDVAWDKELKQFIKSTLNEFSDEQKHEQWKAEENRKQYEFQEKFSTGMQKYRDFQEVIKGKPITDSMMLAARNLENPAAFVYGAAKMHPQELDRIARINDPYAQAAEVGRLHERMVKERNKISKAAPPLETPKSDITHKKASNVSLEQRIDAYAKQKRR